MESRQQVMQLLQMPWPQFEQEVLPQAFEALVREKGGKISAVAMLGFGNICKNQCLYCGMRAGMKGLRRYRMTPQQIFERAQLARAQGMGRLFLISGEDPNFGFDNLLRVAEGVKAMGFGHLAMACGEFDRSQYAQLKAAGVDEYVVKFEMSDPATFDRLNPSTSFRRRMQTIAWVQEAGLQLGSGNIVDYPGQTLEQLADDIWLMKQLGVSWAPNIPYMPAKGTPLAAEGGPGRLEMLYREIAITRLLLPGVDFTAQQPGSDLSRGLSDPQGNLAAIRAGANVLFVDLLPPDQAQDFHVTDNRIVLGLDHVRHVAQLAGLGVQLD